MFHSTEGLCTLGCVRVCTRVWLPFLLHFLSDFPSHGHFGHRYDSANTVSDLETLWAVSGDPVFHANFTTNKNAAESRSRARQAPAAPAPYLLWESSVSRQPPQACLHWWSPFQHLLRGGPGLETPGLPPPRDDGVTRGSVPSSAVWGAGGGGGSSQRDSEEYSQSRGVSLTQRALS